MATQITMQFKPEGFAECLLGAEGIVQSEAEKIAARADGYVTKGSGFHVEVTNEPRFQGLGLRRIQADRASRRE